MGGMKCAHCGRTDSEDSDKPAQCTCYTWFMYTCTVCLVTVLIGVTCCVYCTCLLVSINKTVKHGKDSTESEVSLHGKNGFHEVVAAQGSISQKTNTHTIANAFTHISQLRRRRSETEKKKKKRTKGKGGNRKKKQKTPAAHYVLREGLASGRANCPLGRHTGQRSTEMKQTLDVFKLASFITEKSNPFRAIDGRFIAKKKGLYLVYAQILFEDCRPEEVMKIVQKRSIKGGDIIIQEHFCIAGVANADRSLNNTCSMTALFFLEIDDYLTVVNHYPEVHINLRGNGTFFGAVYLR